MAKAALAQEMKVALLESALATRSIGLQADIAATQAEEDKVKHKRAQYAQARGRLVARGLSTTEILATVARLERETGKPLLEAVGQSLLFNTEVAAKVITTRIDPIHARMLQEMDKLVELQQAGLDELIDRTTREARELDTLLYGLVALAVAIGVLGSAAITRSITRPLRGAVTIARKVADGDLSSDIGRAGQDETGQLLAALRDMTGNLQALVGEVATGAHTVADSSAQIAQGNLDLSQRTEEQASTLEETASSMEELTATVTQNAENARQASRFAVNASEVARRGGQVNTAIAQMDQVVQQNATLVEQAAASTESMKEQSAALLQKVSRFRLGALPVPA